MAKPSVLKNAVHFLRDYKDTYVEQNHSSKFLMVLQGATVTLTSLFAGALGGVFVTGIGWDDGVNGAESSAHEYARYEIGDGLTKDRPSLISIKAELRKAEGASDSIDFLSTNKVGSLSEQQRIDLIAALIEDKRAAGLKVKQGAEQLAREVLINPSVGERDKMLFFDEIQSLGPDYAPSWTKDLTVTFNATEIEDCNQSLIKAGQEQTPEAVAACATQNTGTNFSAAFLAVTGGGLAWYLGMPVPAALRRYRARQDQDPKKPETTDEKYTLKITAPNPNGPEKQS